MFAPLFLQSKISGLCTLALLATKFATQVIGKEYEVPCTDDERGNTIFFDTTMKVLPGDVLLLGTCKFKFE